MKKILAIAVATAISAPAMADMTISAGARYQMDNASGDMTATANRVNVTIAGTTTADSGMFVSGTTTLQLTGAQSNGQDGDNSLTVGNEMANVVLGSFEPAGAFNSGADQFQMSVNNGYEGGLRARNMDNIGLNITEVEGVSIQVSTDVANQDDVRLVVGAAMGGVNATVGLASSDDDAADGLGFTVGTTVGGVALNASYASNEADASSMNINASIAGFTLAVQNDEEASGAEESEVYGAYQMANAGGVEGFTVTVGAGKTDLDVAGEDTRFGARLEYSF